MSTHMLTQLPSATFPETFMQSKANRPRLHAKDKKACLIGSKSQPTGAQSQGDSRPLGTCFRLVQLMGAGGWVGDGREDMGEAGGVKGMQLRIQGNHQEAG